VKKFNEEDFFYISEDKYSFFRMNFGAPVPGDILLTSVGTIGIPYMVPKDFPLYFKDGNLTWFRKYKNVNCRYLYHFMQTQLFRRQLEYSVGGSSQTALTIIKLNQFQIPLPQDIDEQSAIAKVLSDMDTEIEELEKRRDKYLQLKAGMMQQLLTGKIRLKW